MASGIAQTYLNETVATKLFTGTAVFFVPARDSQNSILASLLHYSNVSNATEFWSLMKIRFPDATGCACVCESDTL